MAAAKMAACKNLKYSLKNPVELVENRRATCEKPFWSIMAKKILKIL
jgi:hypothetical protein